MVENNNTKISAKDVDVFYSEKQALNKISMDIKEKEVTALIGPSGCGKSTFLRCINRMNDLIEICKVTGSIKVDNEEIISSSTDVVSLRSKIGMVFQKPNPFPKSIFDNVAYGPSIHGLADTKSDLENIVITSLKKGLCIARAIAVNPEIILMDEPCSALDPIATAIIEELIDELRLNYTIIIVTHSMQQAARVSQKTCFFHLGELIESGETNKIFTNPDNTKTQDYITGRFG